MNLPQIREFVVLCIFSYTLALSVVWSNVAGFWSKIRSKNSKSAIERRQKKPIERVLQDSSLLVVDYLLPKFSLNLDDVTDKIVAMTARGVPLFGGRISSEDENADESGGELGGPMTSDWVGGPRDETTLPRIILATRSSNREECEYAFSEMIRILEKIDLEPNLDVIRQALDVVIRFCQDKSQTEYQCSNLVNHFPTLFDLTSAFPEFKPYKDHMEQYLAICLDATEQFRRHAVYTTGVLLERNSISEDALCRVFIPKLFELAHDVELKDEQRTEIATVLSRICQCCTLSREWMFENYIWRFSKFLEDPVVHVRKAALNVIGDLAALFGGKFTEVFIVPHLIALSDDLNWGIRKVVCEIFVQVSRHAPPFIRRSVLAPRFVRLLQDSSRWVTYQAFQELGPFISTFADSTITGLHIKNGQVCEQSDDVSVVSTRSGYDDFEFDALPAKVWMPNGSPPRSPETEESSESVLNGLQDMLDSWELNNRRSSTHSAPASVSGEEYRSVTTNVISVAAKCSSYENLADLDLYDAESSFLVDPNGESDDEGGDEEEPMESTSEQKDVNMTDLTYWTPEYALIDTDDLVAFGVSCVSPGRSDIISRRLDMLHESTSSPSTSSSNASNSNAESSLSSECDMVLSEMTDERTIVNTSSSETSVDMDSELDLIRDCRGVDEDEEMQVETAGPPSPGAMTQDIVPRELVENFLAMVSSNVTQYGSDINRYCAHNFPAVAYTMGRDNWPQLKETYTKLAKDEQRVRLSVATSIHEMARIVGPDSTDTDLLPIFNSFREQSAELREAVLKNLYEFYKCLTDEKRKTMIEVLPEFMPVDNTELTANWRYRLEFAKQCRMLCCLYGVEEINRTISAIALTLANDRTADVRKEAVHLVVEIIRRLVEFEWPQMTEALETNDDPLLTEQLVQDIVSGFARTQKWTRRQTFANICLELLEQKAVNQEQFRFLILPHVVAMASDRVANVRLAVCKVLRKLDGDMRPIPLGNETTLSVGDILERLAGDVDRDVANEARDACGNRLGPVDIKGRGERLREKEEDFFAQFGCFSQRPNYHPVDMSMSDASFTSSSDASSPSPPRNGLDPTANYDEVPMDICPPQTNQNL